MFENIPWDQVAIQLRDQADKLSGPKGALVGAGLGVATTMAAMSASSRKTTLPILLAGVAIGIAYGATDRKLLGYD
jgi:hypothetical protein